MASRQIRIDPATQLEINVVSRSPHVLGYRVWSRPTNASGAWNQVADGDTSDNIPDNTKIRVAANTSLTYWFGIGGNPNTHYRALLILSQDGQILNDGTLIEEGTSDGNGFAVVEKRVELI